MKISIVIPVYNAERYLEECIESVINQTSTDWELVLVNDGSTDKSADICNSYTNKYPDRISAFHKENEGQFMTRKFGILKCTGDYIGFLDADDYLDKDYVDYLLRYIKQNDSPDTVCFGFVQFGNGINKESVIADKTICFKTSEERKTVYNMIINGGIPGSLWSKIFKRELIFQNIPDEKIVSTKRFAEDAYHSFDLLAKSESVLFIDKSLYFYRDNIQGFSQGFETRTPDYFNSKYLFELIEKNLAIMGIDNTESRTVLYKRNFNETAYFMLKFLRATNSTKRKREIIDFDWTAYLLEGTIKEIEKNPDINKSYLNVWNAFEKKKYLKIFFREKIRKIIGW